MIKINKILFPTDFSRCSEQALEQAIHLAKNYHAELHVLHADILYENLSEAYPKMKEFQDFIDKYNGDQLDDTLSKKNTQTIKIFKKVIRGISAAPVILDYASENDIDLIVMGTQGRRGLSHIFLGSVAEEVVRLSRCPVFTIREKEEMDTVTQYKNILLPIDFSKYSALALKYANEVASIYDAKIQLLHIIETTALPSFYFGGGSPLEDYENKIEENSKKSMDKLTTDLIKNSVRVESYVEKGYAANSIIKFAKHNKNDMIIIFTHGLTGLEHFFMGSVAEKVVRLSPCPVFTFKSFSKNLIESSTN